MKTISQDKLQNLRTLLGNARKAVVISHTHPDGDALGSSTALVHYLIEKCALSSCAVLPDEFPEFLDFIDSPEVIVASRDGRKAVEAISSADLVFCLDLSSLSRAESLSAAVQSNPAPKVLIDHHLDPAADQFDLVFSEIEISSASELLYWILMALEGASDASALPAATALSLLTGMTTDTNNFANSVFPSTLQMASALLSAGVDRDAVLAKLYNRYRENRYRTLGYMLSNLMHITDDGVAYMILGKEDAVRFDIREGETEGFVNMPLGIDRVLLSIFLKEDDGYFRVSIRSMKGVSANRLASESFNGGGHECAAGGRLYFPRDIAGPDAAAEYIEKITARFMRNNAPEQK